MSRFNCVTFIFHWLPLVVYPQSKQASRPCFSDLVTHSFVSQGGANNNCQRETQVVAFAFRLRLVSHCTTISPSLFIFSSLCLSTDLCFALTGSTPSLEPGAFKSPCRVPSVSFNTEVLCPISRSGFCCCCCCCWILSTIHGYEGYFGHV